jgi:hypothetical protein
MQINFRQGIVARQQPNFLQLDSNGGFGVDLLATYNSPTIVTFAQGTTDILFQENTNINMAWSGLSNSVHYWLYWDINQTTGIRTFGTTTLQPIVQSTAPSAPANGQHWYDTVNFVMNVYNNGAWSPRVRVFGGEVNAGTLVQYAVGSQIGNNTTVYAGFILIDDLNLPVKKYQIFNLGEFITTESPLASQSSRLQNFRLETAMDTATASVDIAQYAAVCYTGQNTIGVTTCLTPSSPAIGVASVAFNAGDTNSFIQSGYIYNIAWNFVPNYGSYLFVDTNGNLTQTMPTSGSMQIMGYVVDAQTVFIRPQQIIIFG